jgi:hypothetical protein
MLGFIIGLQISICLILITGFTIVCEKLEVITEAVKKRKIIVIREYEQKEEPRINLRW